MILLDYCHCYGQHFVLEGKGNNNFQTTFTALLVDCGSEYSFNKEACNRIEFSEQSVSQMEENMNNERLKYTQVVFPMLSYSSPSFCSSLSPLSVPVYYFQFYMKKKKDFQGSALSAILCTVSARTAANLHYSWC